jgi:signal transduction histidine kinase
MHPPESPRRPGRGPDSWGDVPPPWLREDWGPGGRRPHGHPGHRHGPGSGWRGAYGYGPRGPFLPTQARLWLPVIVSLVLQLSLVAGELTGMSSSPGDAAIALALAVLGPAALVAARRFPAPVVVVVTVLAVGIVLLFPGALFGYPALAFALPLAVVRGARRWALGSLLAGWLTAFVGGSLLNRPWDPGQVVVVTLVLLFVLGLGESTRTRRARFAELRGLQTRRRVDAAQQERVRIARELHDVLAHSLSSINVQAGVGLHLLESQPEKAGEALASIKATSKQALDEVRSVLGILRSDDSDASAAPLMPEADLARLPQLVESSRSAALDVQLDDRHTTVPSAGAQLALYRIAQEGLTNIVRHSGATSARLELSETEADFVLRVTDNGAGVAAEIGEVAGKGLLGMRERAELLGGRLEAGNNDGGGFGITATIPKRQVREARRQEPSWT